MAIYLVENKKAIAHLFGGWDETMIWSCLQDCMGIAYADKLESPQSAQISLGDFCFFAGVTSDDLLRNKPNNLQPDFAILVPQNQEWEQAIEYLYKEKADRHIRYATKKEKGIFDVVKLRDIVSRLPAQYEIKTIDRTLYKEVLALEWAKDLCANYACYEDYEALGLGFVILKNDDILSGASSYTSYHSGIEIEIDTRQDERRKGLALACGAKIILECLKRNLYPSWDAHNKESLALAQKLGYHFDREYPVYLVEY